MTITDSSYIPTFNCGLTILLLTRDVFLRKIKLIIIMII